MGRLIWLGAIILIPHMAFAMAAAEPNMLIQMAPFLVMFAIFYFLVMRPQATKQKKHQAFVSALKKGDRVLTNSGIFGTVDGMNEKYIILEIANGVKIRLLKSFVAQPISEGKS